MCVKLTLLSFFFGIFRPILTPFTPFMLVCPMTRSFLLTALMCSTLFLAPNSARAAIDAAGAEAVKKMIKSMVDSQIETIQAQSPSLKINMSGDYIVEPKDTYYAVKTPHMIFQFNETKSRQDTHLNAFFTVDYGSNHINVMPGTVANQWRMAVALPSPIRIKTKFNADCGTNKACKEKTEGTKNVTSSIFPDEITINQKTTKFQILWDDAQKIILKQEGLIENTHIKADDKDLPFTFGPVAWTSQATPKSPGIFNGQSFMSIKGLSIDVTPENCKTCKTSGKIGVGEIAINTSHTGFDLKKYNDFNRKMMDMTNAGFNPEKGMSPQAFSALWSEIMKNGFDTIDSGKGDITLRDVAVNITDKEGKVDSFSLKELKYYAGFDSWRSDKANLYAGIDMGAMKLPTAAQTDPMFKALTGYIPTQAHHKFELKNLPHRKLFEQMGSMTQNFISSIGPEKCPATMPVEECQKKAGQSIQQAQLLGMQAMMTLPQLLAQAGTVVTLHADSDAPKSTTLLDANFSANSSAVYTGVGKLKAVLGGLDAMIADLQTAAKDPTVKPEDAAQINGALGTLTMLQSKGQVGKDAKGNNARTYEITIDEKGAVKLNGADMMPAANAGSPVPTVPDTKKP